MATTSNFISNEKPDRLFFDLNSPGFDQRQRMSITSTNHTTRQIAQVNSNL
jgi:hypothetical protein